MILKLDNNKIQDNMGTKTYYVFMGPTYSNKTDGYKHTRKNNDTEQLENNNNKYTIRTYRFTII